MRGSPPCLPWSTPLVAWLKSQLRTWLGVAVGCVERYLAITPVTIGAANEVPVTVL